MPSPYALACCQPSVRTVFDGGVLRRAILDANIAGCCAAVTSIAGDTGAAMIVFPQFGLTGYAPVETAQWIAASVRIPGPETDRVAAAARAVNAYVALSVTEVHDRFPNRYFSSVVLFGPDGEILMIHRKNYVLSTRTRPIDVADAFAQVFGEDAFLPVVDTPLGRMGVAVAGEVYWAEAVRSLAARGAEVILNPTSAPPIYYQGRPAEPFIRPVRAFENLVYLACANTGEMVNADGSASGAGADAWPPSEIFDYRGARIAVAGPGGDRVTTATIDIDALRSARDEPFANLLAQRQGSLHARADRAGATWPVNAFADRPVGSFDELKALEAQVWAELQRGFVSSNAS